MSYACHFGSSLRKPRRSFESLEIRLAASETLLSLAAASLIEPHPISLKTADRDRTAYEAPPGDTMNVFIAPPRAQLETKARTVPPVSIEATDAVHSGFIDLASEIRIGKSPAPEPEPAKAAPVSSVPNNLNNAGVSSSPAPGGSAAPGGGGGGGGGASFDAAAGAGAQQLAPAPHSPAVANAANTPAFVSPMDDYQPPPPTADDSSASGYHDSPITGNVTAEGGTGSYTFSVYSGPSSGQLTLNPDGSFSYTGNYHFYGTDSFTFIATDDGTGEISNLGTVTLTVGETAPTVMNDEYWTYHDSPISQTAPGVLANDGDAESDPLTAMLNSGPGHAASFTLNSDGSFNYTPTAGYVGDDGFDYNASDGILSTTAHVTIHVTDTAPVAADDGIDSAGNYLYQVSWNETAADSNQLVMQGGNVPPSIQSNDYDADSDPITSILASGPSHGTLTSIANPGTLGSDGDFIYTPAVGFSGYDTFTYVDSDGIEQSNPATVSILVQGGRLDIWDGQDGLQVPIDKTRSRGAFTVANTNDTQGNGTPDNTEAGVLARKTTLFAGLDATSTTLSVVSPLGFAPGDWIFIESPNDTQKSEVVQIQAIDGNDFTLVGRDPEYATFWPAGSKVMHGGKNENDLMKIVVQPPNPSVPNTSVTIVPSDASLTFWKDQFKLNRYPTAQDGSISIPVDQLPLTLYVEAGVRSNAMRDLSLSYVYQGRTTMVDSITAIWAAATPRYDTVDVQTLFGTGPGMQPTSWNDMNGAARTQVSPSPGLPDNGLGITAHTNTFAVQYDVLPPRNVAVEGSWDSDGVEFVAIEQQESRVDSQDVNTQQWTSKGMYRPLDLLTPQAVLFSQNNSLSVNNRWFTVTQHIWVGSDLLSAERERDNYQEWLTVSFKAAVGQTAGSQVSQVVSSYSATSTSADAQGNWTRDAAGNGVGAGRMFINFKNVTNPA